MFRFFSRTVSVTFVDAATGARIATSQMPPDELPDSFALDTQLELAGAQFVVVRAEPETKAEFSRTKQLQVTVRRIETLDPRQILFSLPTLCGAALPGCTRTTIQGNTVVLHEDDWRQCEFIADRLREEISTELAGVRRIHAEEATEVGWREIHVRERIEQPIPSGIHWETIAELLGDVARVDGIAIGRRENLVIGAVAARLPEDVVVWGISGGHGLTVLCVENLETASEATIAVLKRIADNLGLALVSWCRCQVYSPSGTVLGNALGTPWGGRS